MNEKKIKLFLAISSLLLLIACPASNFYNYSYLGSNAEQILNGKQLNNKILSHFQNAKCGFLYGFTEDKDRLLIVRIDSITEKIKFIESKKLGRLKKVDKTELDKANIDNSEVYMIEIEVKNKNKILKKLKNDRIVIQLENGLKYYYEKK